MGFKICVMFVPVRNLNMAATSSVNYAFRWTKISNLFLPRNHMGIIYGSMFLVLVSAKFVLYMGIGRQPSTLFNIGLYGEMNKTILHRN